MREEQKKIIQTEMDRLKHLGIIRKGLTGYSSPVVLVKRKSQNLYQVCSDFCICHATGMEEDPKVTLDIQCLWQGGGAALTSTNNYFLHRGGSGSARAITV